ncbi:hypothetical protein GCM10027155_14830 [Acinetobacter apis]
MKYCNNGIKHTTKKGKATLGIKIFLFFIKKIGIKNNRLKNAKNSEKKVVQGSKCTGKIYDNKRKKIKIKYILFLIKNASFNRRRFFQIF